MKKSRKNIPETHRDFKGPYHPKIRRIRTEHRKKIRQRLRSFLPLRSDGQFGEDPEELI